ncbi:cell division cycle-associated 7-like protein isoform X1 [Crotalus tigris]|uniref:cell division cycle-associated 7-like protein isoform X1 n=1 Tax=Crotalus tigris TaxID=88082 RepID=UPI00192F7876|nr:cell division cycle-associated 7-like protein isoform X1 [Crotalus tigris]XP_039198070.1 cell division cycle-associated 7-like protein isoform X1 [Crotalus tigris]XP_039198071.1 cell division cycle-associated 7-like protein isoform X1 [Crotalus tigris]
MTWTGMPLNCCSVQQCLSTYPYSSVQQLIMDLADIFNAPSDEEDFLGFELDIPIETLSLEDRNENVDLPGTSGMAMELEPDNNPSLMEEDKEKEEEMEIESSHKKKSFKIQGALQLPNKSAEKTSPKFCSSNSNQTKNTNGRNEDQDTSSDSEIDEAPDENSNVLLKRDQNIKENKAVLAQLLAELDSIPPSIQMKTSSSAPKRKKKPRKISSGGPIQRRTNPTRSARPPENFGVERSPSVEYLDNETYHNLLKRKLNGHILGMPKKRKLSRIAALRSIVITNEDLANIAFTNKDKIHHKILGTTCHQCRQKTMDTKTICHNEDCVGVRGQFCGPCLRNRYGEDVKVALLNPEWLCPPCRGVCNCSYCRKRDGYCATGTLIHLAKLYGYSNVREYLESLPMHHVNGNQ